MTRKSQGINLVLPGIDPELKLRLKLEALKQRTSTSKIVFEILDKVLPAYEEIVNADDNVHNGKNGAKTLRQEFEKASSGN